MLLQIPILLYFNITAFLEKFTLPCYFKKTTGIDCPLCGGQRAFLELLQGNIQKSFLLYPALIPILIMFLYTFLHARFKFKDGAENTKYLFMVNVAIIIFSYIYKLINY